MMQAIANIALSAARVLPAIEMLKDFSDSAEAEARVAAQALLGLGALGSSCASFLVSSVCFGVLSHFVFCAVFGLLALPLGYGAYLCKLRLDQTRKKLEQLKVAALASRTARSLGSKAIVIASAAASAGKNAGKAAGNAVASLAEDAATLPAASGKAAANGALAAMDAANAAAQALADPATRKAAVDLAGEAFHGLARGAGIAAGWLKARKSVTPEEAPIPPEPK